jgi:hypothetical protein
LANAGIEAISFKGPILAIRAFHNIGLRVFRDLDFLVRDSDLAPAIATLHSLGYERTGQLTAAQFDLIHRIQGQEIIFNKANGTCIEPHTRLTSIKMALDIDYAALWRRARRMRVNGRTVLTMAPEDDILCLAIHGGKEMWCNIKEVCDFAALIGSHPELDWTAILERAHNQGCLRIVLLATALARKYFNSPVPDMVAAAERADPALQPMIDRIIANWQAEHPVGPPDNATISFDRLRLHRAGAPRIRYVARTLFLPGPQYVASIPLPGYLGFAYIPLKVAHDLIAWPLWRAYREVCSQAARLRNVLAGAILPSP